MFYPDLLVYELVLCVGESPAYLDMQDFPRLELGAHILRNSGQNIISVTLKKNCQWAIKGRMDGR
jgi:hypothetical protein